MIKVQIPKDKYFKMVLEILSPLKPYSSLTKMEREVLSILLELNYLHKDIAYEDRMKIIFNYETRRSIAERMKISVYNLNNLYKELREHKFIDLYSIDKRFLFTPDAHNEFLFTFNGDNK